MRKHIVQKKVFSTCTLGVRISREVKEQQLQKGEGSMSLEESIYVALHQYDIPAMCCTEVTSAGGDGNLRGESIVTKQQGICRATYQ